MQPSALKCNQLKPSATKCTLVQPSATRCNQMNSNETKFNQVLPSKLSKTKLNQFKPSTTKCNKCNQVNQVQLSKTMCNQRQTCATKINLREEYNNIYRQGKTGKISVHKIHTVQYSGISTLQYLGQEDRGRVQQSKAGYSRGQEDYTLSCLLNNKITPGAEWRMAGRSYNPVFNTHVCHSPIPPPSIPSSV